MEWDTKCKIYEEFYPADEPLPVIRHPILPNERDPNDDFKQTVGYQYELQEGNY